MERWSVERSVASKGHRTAESKEYSRADWSAGDSVDLWVALAKKKVDEKVVLTVERKGL
jgi:hypothetical protein